MPQTTLTYFVLLSAALHAAVASSWLLPRPATPQRLGSEVLNVSLRTERHAPAGTGMVDARHAQRIASANAPRPAATDPGNDPLPAAPSATPRDTPSQLLGEIHTRLSRYLTYPPLARERGWEGTVLLGFRVGPEGGLERVHVARSSGYAVLDHSALDAVRRVGQVETTIRFAGRALDLQLPVVYRLTDN